MARKFQEKGGEDQIHGLLVRKQGSHRRNIHHRSRYYPTFGSRTIVTSYTSKKFLIFFISSCVKAFHEFESLETFLLLTKNHVC